MKCLKCLEEFLRRFDLSNGKYLSIFLRELSLADEIVLRHEKSFV